MASNNQQCGTAANYEQDPATQIAFYRSLSLRDQRIYQAYRADGFDAARAALNRQWQEDQNENLYGANDGNTHQGADDDREAEVSSSEVDYNDGDQTLEQHIAQHHPSVSATAREGLVMLQAVNRSLNQTLRVTDPVYGNTGPPTTLHTYPYFDQALRDVLTENGAGMIHRDRHAGFQAANDAVRTPPMNNGNDDFRPDMRNPYLRQQFENANAEPFNQTGGETDQTAGHQGYPPTRPRSGVVNRFGAAQDPYTPDVRGYDPLPRRTDGLPLGPLRFNIVPPAHPSNTSGLRGVGSDVQDKLPPRENNGGGYQNRIPNPYDPGRQNQPSGLDMRKQELDDWNAALNQREQAVAAREAQMAWLEQQRDSSSGSSRVGRVGQIIKEEQGTPTPQASKRKREVSADDREVYDQVDFGAAVDTRPTLQPRSVLTRRSNQQAPRRRLSWSTRMANALDDFADDESDDDGKSIKEESSEDDMPPRPIKKARTTGPTDRSGREEGRPVDPRSRAGMDARGRTVFQEGPPRFRGLRTPSPVDGSPLPLSGAALGLPRRAPQTGREEMAEMERAGGQWRWDPRYPVQRMGHFLRRPLDPNTVAGHTTPDLPQEVRAAYERENRRRAAEAATANATRTNGPTAEEQLLEQMQQRTNENRRRLLEPFMDGRAHYDHPTALGQWVEFLIQHEREQDRNLQPPLPREQPSANRDVISISSDSDSEDGEGLDYGNSEANRGGLLQRGDG